MRGSSCSQRQAFTATSARPTPAKALRVVPPSAQAARPVEAVANVAPAGSAASTCRSSSDFPVPAQPVKNTLRPALQQAAHS